MNNEINESRANLVDVIAPLERFVNVKPEEKN